MPGQVGPAGGSGNGSSLTRQVAKTLTNAQILALPSTGIEVLPSLGSNLVALPTQAAGVLNTAAGAYTASADASWSLLYSGSGSHCTNPCLMQTLLTATALSLYLISGPGFLNNGGTFDGSIETSGLPLANAAGRAVLIKDDFGGVANYGAGNAANSATITVAYLIYNTSSGQFQ